MSFKSPYKTLRAAFEANVSKQENGCWLWLGNINKGRAMFTHRPSGLHVVSASRTSWNLYKRKKLKPHEFALHKCDNGECVNPAHLFRGTQVDNMKDMAKKGRSTRGEKHPSVKLTADQVVAIRKDVRSGKTIAEVYGVTPSAICDIRRGRTWAHL